MDAECYPLAYDFVCQVLQPACRSSQPEDLLQLPCRSFCREFWNGCGSRLPEKIKRALDCSNFPGYAAPGSCRPKPGATNYEIARLDIATSEIMLHAFLLSAIFYTN